MILHQDRKKYEQNPTAPMMTMFVTYPGHRVVREVVTSLEANKVELTQRAGAAVHLDSSGSQSSRYALQL